MAIELKKADIGPWPKGIITGVDDASIPPDALKVADNISFDPVGAAYRRYGYWNSTTALTNKLGLAIQEWITTSDNKRNIIFRSEQNFYVWRNESSLDSFTYPLDQESGGTWVQLNSDHIYAVYPKDGSSTTPVRFNWNGSGSAVTSTGVAAATFTVADKDAGTPTDQFPWAEVGLVKHDRVWVADVEVSGGSRYPSRIHFSDLLQPTKWYGLDYIDVEPDDGGGIITMVEYGEGILIFKERGIWLLSGSTPETFALTKLTGEFGVSKQNLVAVRDSDVFFSMNYRLYRFNGQQFIEVSERLGQVVDAEFNVTSIENRIYWDVSYNDAWPGSQAYGTLVYDVTHDRFESHTGSINGGLKTGGPNPRLYFVGLGSKGLYQSQWWAFSGADSLDDAGTDITAAIETGMIAPEGGGEDYRVVRLDAVFGEPNLGDAYSAVDITLERDYSAAKQTSVTVTPSATNRHARMSGFTNERWSDARILVDNTSGGSFKLNKLELRYTLGRRHRGVDV